MKTRIWQTVCVLAFCAAMTIAGCKVSKQDNGEDKRVSVDVPGASVKVDTATDVNDSGLPLYPGAQPKAPSGDEKHRANVNVDMPFLKLKVVALKYTSQDSPDKVLAFYREKLGVYGKVQECKGGEDVEVNPGHDNWDSPVNCGEISKKKGDDVTLKAGTKGNEHVVSVKPNGSGAEMELVYVRAGSKKDDVEHGSKDPS